MKQQVTHLVRSSPLHGDVYVKFHQFIYTSADPFNRDSPKFPRNRYNLNFTGRSSQLGSLHFSIHDSSANGVFLSFFLLKSLHNLGSQRLFQWKLTTGLCRSVQISKETDFFFGRESSFEFSINREVIIRSRQCINVGYCGVTSPVLSFKDVWWFCACLSIARDLHFRYSWVEEIQVQLSVWPTLSSTKDQLLGLLGPCGSITR